MFNLPRRISRGAFFPVRLAFALALISTGLLLGFFTFNVGATQVRLGPSAPQLLSVAPRDKVTSSKIARWVLDRTAAGRQAEFLVVLADQADLAAARAVRSKRERRRSVRDALWTTAQQTQQPILQWLREHKIEHRPFYIVNAIWVKADGQTAATLAARPDVLRVEGNPQIRNELIEFAAAGISPSKPEAVATVEPGIAYSHAPEVWSLGYTGQGIVIAGADTGYRWTHTALKNHYRGWNGLTANHDYNWHDSIHSGGGGCGHDSTAPCDDVAHGTHTMGTAIGDDGLGNQIGMAPGAKWIGCRNMDQGNGTPASYIECMEFFLAPYPVGGTPGQGDPNLAPDITTNSWTCPQSEGCSPDTLQMAVEAQRAAGIFMVVAAGNGGTAGCHTIHDPPSIYDAAYTVGALNTGSDTIAFFSSRGSVTADGSSRLKPDLAAPGTNVRSSIRDSDISYSNMSGTSMATPHVAGAVALLWSAVPILRNNIAATETILNQSAVPLNSAECDAGGVPNNTFGNGRLDVKSAVDCALLETTPVTTTRDDQTGAVTVTFYAGVNRTYRLEHRFPLDGPDWSGVSGVNDLIATGDGPAQLTDPNAGADTQQFYRVRLVQ